MKKSFLLIFVILLSIIKLYLNCKSDELDCKGNCYDNKIYNQCCLDKPFNNNDGVCCYKEVCLQPSVCCSIYCCTENEVCCNFSCCISGYKCIKDKCIIDYNFSLFMYTPFILIFLSLGLMILYVIKYRPTKKDSLPVVSNEAMRKGLHEQPGENRNEIMCQINNEIRTLTFKDRLEFEKYILGYLNSYFWLGSTAATLLTTVPILVAIIINEYTSKSFPLHTTNDLSLEAEMNSLNFRLVLSIKSVEDIHLTQFTRSVCLLNVHLISNGSCPENKATEFDIAHIS